MISSCDLNRISYDYHGKNFYLLILINALEMNAAAELSVATLVCCQELAALASAATCEIKSYTSSVIVYEIDDLSRGTMDM